MQEISRQIWDMKYRFKAADGTPVDRDVADSWARVALALAQAEAPRTAAGRGARLSPARWRATNSFPPGAFWPAPAPAAASPCSTAS